MNIYQLPFTPTYLYIKIHNKTRLKYFGKTTNKNPIKYMGHGKYWRRHLEKHGNDVDTLWYHLYTDKTLLIEEALAFSNSHDIVNSQEWANLKLENGIDGGAMPGHVVTSTTRKKIGDKNRGRKMSDSFSQMRSANMKKQMQAGRTPWNKNLTGITSPKKGKKYLPLTDAHKEKISKSLKGKSKPKRTKEHSLNISKAKVGKVGHLHTNNAKKKISLKNKGKKKMLNIAFPNTYKMVTPTDIPYYELNGWYLKKA